MNNKMARTQIVPWIKKGGLSLLPSSVKQFVKVRILEGFIRKWEAPNCLVSSISCT